MINSLLVFLPAILCGGLIAHLLWPERRPAALVLKASAGVGIGLGINSFLYFASLLIAPGKFNILPVMLVLLAGSALAVWSRERGHPWNPLRLPRLSRLQWILTAVVGLAAVFLLITFHNLYLSLPQGWIDAWTIWNRAARSIFRDIVNWQMIFSSEWGWMNHADYPLLIPFNIAWGWQTLGVETPRIPMMQALLFTLASLGILGASLGLTRSPAQAGLGTLILASTPVFILTGSYQIADVPVMYFILASLVFLYLSLARQDGRPMVLAGLMAGLAGWTKNEGLLFFLVIILVLFLTRHRDLKHSLLPFAAGLALPLAVMLIFKSMAPSSEFASAESVSLFARITEPTRYLAITRELGSTALRFGYWPVSLLAVLAVYALVIGLAPAPGAQRNIFTIAAIIILQFLGYCAIFLLSPYDLEWHLSTAMWRLLLQIFPAALFVYLLLVREPEAIF